MVEKQTKYINKNCEWCLKNWWDGKERITKPCGFHQQYSFEHTLKQFKKNKEEIISNRIFCLVLSVALFLFFTYVLVCPEVGAFLKILFSLVLSVLIGIVWWTFYDTEKFHKDYNKEIKKELKEFERIDK